MHVMHGRKIKDKGQQPCGISAFPLKFNSS
jgi:hypothetical protein